MADRILTLSGLPVGRSAVLYDLLARVQRDGKWCSLPVRVVTVATDGTLTITGLRDSRYALLFTAPALVVFSRYRIEVGEPGNYRTRYLGDAVETPLLTQVSSVVANNEIGLQFKWSLRNDYGVTHYELYAERQDVDAAGVPVIIPGRNARSGILPAVQPETQYECYLVACGLRLKSKPSHRISVTTPQCPIAEPNLIINGNFEQMVW